MVHSILRVSTSCLLLLAWFHNEVLVTNASSFRSANAHSPISTRIGLGTSVAFLSPTNRVRRHTHSHWTYGQSRATCRSISNQRTPSNRVLSGFLSNNDQYEQGEDANNEQESNLKRIYHQVQQDDADWYYSTLSKFLGDDAVLDKPINVLDGDKDDEGVRSIDSEDDRSASFDHETLTYDQKTSGTTRDKVDRPVTSASVNDNSSRDIAETPLRTKESIQNQDTASNDEYDGYHPSAVGDIDDISNRQVESKKVDTVEKANSPKASRIVQLRNKYTKQSETIAELSKLINMGYTQSDILLLRPRVLELIVEDSIPKPRRGMPDRWLRDVYEDLDDEDADWEVEVVSDDSTVLKGDDDGDGIDSPDKVQRSGKVDASYNPDDLREKEAVNERPTAPSSDENVSESWGPFSSSRIASKVNNDEQNNIDMKEGRDFKGQQDEVGTGPASFRRSADRQQRLQPTMADNDDIEPRRLKNRRTSPSRRSYYEEEEDVTYQKPNRPQSPRAREGDRREPRTRRRRELVIDRDGDGDDNDPPPNKFWMDLPTFRDFLRTEARLRLKILGPDWKESVLDESRWRFDLYKRWLFLLDDGVGENPLYTYGDRPSQPRPRRPRSSRRERSYESPTLREPPIRTRQGRSGSVVREQEPYSETEDDDTREGSLREDRPEEFSSQRGVPQSRSNGNGSRETIHNESSRDYGKVARRPARRGEVGRRSMADNERERARYGEVEDREMLQPRGGSEGGRDDWPSRRPSSSRPSSSRREQPDLKNFNDLEQYLQRSSESVSNERRDEHDDAPRRRKRSSNDVLNERIQ
ncbi:hypothetical protein HJC23_011280 [Cyclotella cryptica]|uniref:Uncharacterized protein n=1 Tax=Cyclotella cryptica TaxID=29204 RepID=A0ABD3QVV0_9STRA|eukprot:CCRYP_001676-RA/>CCRYP_001676-RA protein AED:0.06 eAED:0.06 QI:222/-1/1/1/-1/1/1/101/810